MTCLRRILRYMRLEIWRKIGLCGHWRLCTALRSRSGACYYWIGRPTQGRPIRWPRNSCTPRWLDAASSTCSDQSSVSTICDRNISADSEKLLSHAEKEDHVPGYAHLPPHRWTTLYHGCARSSANGRSHMRVLPPGTLCPTTSAPFRKLLKSHYLGQAFNIR